MTPIEYIKEKKLDWQPSFNGALSNGKIGYRGALIVEEGKVLAAGKQLPPKAQAKQVIAIANDSKFELFACELESFDHFIPLMEKFKDYFSADGINMLFVIDLDVDGMFEYEGITFYAYTLDESSVWNEVLDKADLDKGDVKKLSNEEKIETIYEELSSANLTEKSYTYDEIKKFQSDSAKQLMGAV